MARDALKTSWRKAKEEVKFERKIYIKFPEKHVGHFVGNVSSLFSLFLPGFIVRSN